MLWKVNELHFDVPLPIVKGRPLIVVHPACGANYLSSWSVMVEHGQPFVLVCDDLYPDYPDEWPFHRNADGGEYFVRMTDSCEGDRVYRNPELGFDNLLVLRQADAKVGLDSLPLVDILFIDWLDAIGPVVGNTTFSNTADYMASRVRAGGIIILDRKHSAMAPEWFDSANNEADLAHLGNGEWPIPVLKLPCGGGIDTEVFRVEHDNQQEVVFEFLSTLGIERRMSPADLEIMLRRIPNRTEGDFQGVQ